MMSIYAAVATTEVLLVFATAGIPAVRAQPSINAECSEQTVEYGSGAIRQWSQDLLASQTYTWSTIGQTSEVGARGAVVLLAASPRFEPRPLP